MQIPRSYARPRGVAEVDFHLYILLRKVAVTDEGWIGRLGSPMGGFRGGGRIEGKRAFGWDCMEGVLSLLLGRSCVFFLGSRRAAAL
ncbi:unnamed protein product [Vitrella brassicaformis CCMP3155]|uniref:Uncharacterized protein n=1 Tax=Vitrella brassicaformis (strain CCMP3155) TaxID=1169540 RepID=A0A0G4EQU8_VITBC|nr:unnamed protein product [Vitrella brassicaformis CCMP3155]|eukprot:CEL99625.1 unnamed protein product [Vitrella brassicaformis CCMP3155]